MALDGPYTLDDLLVMTGHKKKKRLEPPVLVSSSAKQTRSLRLLGIDPGTRCVGWGMIERRMDNSLRLIECGCVRPGDKLELKDRLCGIFSELEEIIARLKPDAAALEETFAGINMKSAIAMGEGRGIALLCLARAKLDILELAPRSIKQSVTGNGASSKEAVAQMVVAQLGLSKTPEPEDVTDALAAAIALARRV
ncbi:MAG TPA: crossover junction endodeoxyribonuclease RuvC [Planctomycetota bacterium]|nr:crossover junction endodeoxyribonuclease RuvC [Planctomycetota bacterium]